MVIGHGNALRGLLHRLDVEREAVGVLRAVRPHLVGYLKPLEKSNFLVQIALRFLDPYGDYKGTKEYGVVSIIDMKKINEHNIFGSIGYRF